jgi:hypothetical protein
MWRAAAGAGSSEKIIGRRGGRALNWAGANANPPSPTQFVGEGRGGGRRRPPPRRRSRTHPPERRKAFSIKHFRTHALSR